MKSWVKIYPADLMARWYPLTMERAEDFNTFLLALLTEERGKHELADSILKERDTYIERMREAGKRGAEVRRNGNPIAKPKQGHSQAKAKLKQGYGVAKAKLKPGHSTPLANTIQNNTVLQESNLFGNEEAHENNDFLPTSSSSSSSSSLPVKSEVAGPPTAATRTTTSKKESLDGTIYEGLEEAVEKSPLSVKRFLSVATAGTLRREAAEHWLRVNEAGSWTITDEDGTERAMKANETARRLAAFCKADKERRRGDKKTNVYGREWSFPRASNYLPPTPEELEKFKGM